MITYQDFLAAPDKGAFILQIVAEHKASAAYRIAADADQYARQRNVTITNYRKMLYTLSGAAVPDNWSANYKIPCNLFSTSLTTFNQFLLGNGVTLTDENNKARLGADFDTRLQQLGRAALLGGVAFGFWNFDHMDSFRLTEFAPLWDEETGGLMAGIRFWQLESDKPMRLTLYEIDGYTEYRAKDGIITVLRDKRPYRLKIAESEAGGVEIIDGENYPTFPIVPFWGNPEHQSELIGKRETIDCYDLIKSGFANDLDDAAMIYWTITNAGGMDDGDLAQFVERLKTVKAAAVDADNGVNVEAHTIQIPYESRVAYLDKLREDYYSDAQIIDVTRLSSSARTATEIRTAYQPMECKADQYEYCVLDFLSGIFRLAGIDDVATFKRSRIVNQLEETQMILAASAYLDDETVLRKLPFLTPDEVSGIMEARAADDLTRMGVSGDDNGVRAIGFEIEVGDGDNGDD